jgi:hypothetical protein
MTNGVAMRPEEELLLRAARSYFDPNAVPLLRSVAQQPLDWNYAIQIAESHGLLPLLSRQVEAYCAGRVPAAAFGNLQSRCREISVRMLLLTRELIEVLRLFRAGGIASVPYKGPALSALLYGDHALRQSDDLDLMIPAEGVWRAIELLESQGFRPCPPLRREQLAAYFRTECDMVFAHSKPGLFIDLHWALVPPYHGYYFQAAELWDRLESMDLLGEKIDLLSPDSNLTALCLHGSKHMWARLGWVCDIAALLQPRRGLDWERVLFRARTWRCERVLLLGLSMAHDLLDAGLPAQVASLSRARPEIIVLAQHARKRLFEGRQPGFWALTCFRLRLIDGPVARIRYCIHRLLFPSYNDLEWIRLPESLSFLYFILRPIRLTVAWVREKLSR